MKKCSVCGYPVDEQELHEESLPIPEGFAFYFVHASCAGVDESEKAWVIGVRGRMSQNEANM